MGWVLRWQGETYREGDITIGQAEQIEKLIGENWFGINVLRTAKHALSVLAVMHTHRTGRPFDEVKAEVADIPVNVYAQDVYGEEPDDLPVEYTDGNPPAAAAPSTRTSRSSANRRGAGRQK